jgi:TusA-related sulfurtransferase
VVLYRGAHGSGASSHIDAYHRKACAVAYRWAEVKFSLVLGGSHAVSYDAALKLITAMNITLEQTVWEIGCGVPALAAAMSAGTARVVLCTDLGATFQVIKEVCKKEMRNRVMKQNEEACLVELRALSDLEGYADSLTPFTEQVPSVASLITAMNAQIPQERRESLGLKIKDVVGAL